MSYLFVGVPWGICGGDHATAVRVGRLVRDVVHMSSSALQDIVNGRFLAGRVVAVDVLYGARSSKGEPVWADANDGLLH